MENNKVIKHSDLALFCYQYSVVLKSGIPYLEAIHLLAEDVIDEKMKGYATSIAGDVEEGLSLSEAFSRQSVFPVYTVEMIRIAETSGKLPEVFERLSDYYEQSDQIKQKVKSALTYPIILIALMTGVILLLVVKILPIFHDILLSVGGTVPGATQAILNVSMWLQSGIFIILGLIGIALIFLWVVFNTNAQKTRRDRWLLKLPIVKQLYKLSVTIKFAKALSMLVHSGMDIDRSFEMIIPLVDNEHISSALKESLTSIEKGEDYETVLKGIDVFPELFLKMMRIGRKTGSLDQTLDRIAGIYDKELTRKLQKISASIEPALVIILSVVVGAIMLLVMLPLINIMSSIG
jgi:type IV pilus assembly protein PilC